MSKNINEELKNKIENLIAEGKEINETDIIKIVESAKNISIEDRITEYLKKKKDEERTEDTIKDTESKIRHFLTWGNINSLEEITKDKYQKYREYLKETKKEEIATRNKRIVMINGFLTFCNLKGYCLKQEKVQNKSSLENVYSMREIERIMKFCNSTREYDQAKKIQDQAKTKEEIKKANAEMRKAKFIMKKKRKTKVIIQIFLGLGIRDAELEFVTIEQIKKGSVTVTNKGKTRTIPVSRELKKELLGYCKEEGITTGCIIRSQNKNSERLSHSQIWRNLQWSTGQMRINKDKAHEHGIRHLAGKEFARISGQNRKFVADMLGHSDTKTSDIYLQMSFEEQKAEMQKMNIKKLSKAK